MQTQLKSKLYITAQNDWYIMEISWSKSFDLWTKMSCLKINYHGIMKLCNQSTVWQDRFPVTRSNKGFLVPYTDTGGEKIMPPSKKTTVLIQKKVLEVHIHCSVCPIPTPGLSVFQQSQDLWFLTFPMIPHYIYLMYLKKLDFPI